MNKHDFMSTNSSLEGLIGTWNLDEETREQQADLLQTTAFLLQRRISMAWFQDSALLAFPPRTWLLSLVCSLYQETMNLSTSFLFRDVTRLICEKPGSHTIGQARCTSFRARIYNETNLDTSFAQTRQRNCPRASGVGDNNLAPLDLQTPTNFENNYFKNLVNRRGLLHSDQQLFNGGSTDSIVRTYSNDPNTFNSDFTAAMIRMGDITPLTGSNGEIRKNCRRLN